MSKQGKRQGEARQTVKQIKSLDGFSIFRLAGVSWMTKIELGMLFMSEFMNLEGVSIFRLAGVGWAPNFNKEGFSQAA